MASSLDFQPCPFCGSADVGYGYRNHPDGHELCFITCSDCCSNGPVRAYNSVYDDDESASAWNKRAA